MGRVAKYSYDEWLEKTEGKVVCSCGVRFEDGFLGTFVRRRIPTIIKEIESLKKEHGDVACVATSEK